MLEYLPTEQLVHELALPNESVDFPGSHDSHEEDCSFAAYVPGRQPIQLDALASLYDPCWQTKQYVLTTPSPIEKVPGSQLSQDVAPSLTPVIDP